MVSAALWKMFWAWGGLSNSSELAHGLGAAIMPFIVSSLPFMVITQVSHQQPETQKAEDALELQEASSATGLVSQEAFARAQVVTSCDYSVLSHFWGVVTGALNVQGFHHVFPGVCSCHYRHLYPKFEAICRKHDVKLTRRDNIGHALYTMCKYQFELGLEDPEKLLSMQKEY